MVKKLTLGQSHLDLEYNSRTMRLYGEIANNGFVAWINSASWLSLCPDMRMTVDEKLNFMRACYGYVWDEYFHTYFVDDNIQSIFFDSHGAPLVYIENNTIKSSKPNISCICHAFEKVADFSDTEFKQFHVELAVWVRNAVLKEVHVRKKYGTFHEKWYECKKCQNIWRLVSPNGTFRGLWEKITIE